MQTILVSGNDTDIGKTHVLGQLAGTLAASCRSVQIVKLVETGMPLEDSFGDADQALRCAREIAEPNKSGSLTAFRLARYTQPLAPLEAARWDGGVFSIADLKEKLKKLPLCDVRLIEGAGGLAVPIDAEGMDWADFARDVVDATVLVVENRLGAISQARLLVKYCESKGVPVPLFWLNEIRVQNEKVRNSNWDEILKTRVPVIGQSFPGEKFSVIELEKVLLKHSPKKGEGVPVFSSEHVADLRFDFYRGKLEETKKLGRERQLSMVPVRASFLDLSANDYLDLARDAATCAGAIRAVGVWGASSSASPLITGYKEIHAELEKELCMWLGFRCGLIWNTGYAANACVLGTLPQKRDCVFADRLIHNSMISGILRSGAKFQRYRHNDVAHLRELLEKMRSEKFTGTVFVVTESVFSMDGDYPDLAEMARLRDEFHFVWIVDEAHATGWFGKRGGGLIDALGLASKVDILIGTLGKSLGSAGAYTLFNDETLRRYLINFGAEFIFSTYLLPSACGAALAAIQRIKNFSEKEREAMPALSQRWRARLRKIVPEISDGDSAVISVPIGTESETLRISKKLFTQGFRVGAIRPPTVPLGTARLRISLNRNLSETELSRFASALDSVFIRAIKE